MLLIFSYGDHSEFCWMIYQRIATKFVVLWRLLREMCIFRNCILKIKTNYIHSQPDRLQIRHFTTLTQSKTTRNVHFEELHFEDRN